MAKEWTDDEVAALIADSVKIVADDKEREHYNFLHGKYGPKEGDTDQGDGKTPPPKKEKDEKDKKAKRPLWGSYADSDES